MSLMYCELELLICLQFHMAVTRRACQFVVANGPFKYHFSTLVHMFWRNPLGPIL